MSTGFGVEAIDGSIGKVDEATYDTDSSSIVVDTGPWIFGRKVMLPAGVDRPDRLRRREGLHPSHEGRDQGRAGVRRGARGGRLLSLSLGSYYGPNGAGYRAFDDAKLQGSRR